MKALYDLISVKGFTSPIKKQKAIQELNGEYEVLKSFWNVRKKGFEGQLFSQGDKIVITSNVSEEGYRFSKGAIKEGYLKALKK